MLPSGGPTAPGVIRGPARGTPVRVGIGWLNVDALVAATGDSSRVDGAAKGSSKEAAVELIKWMNAHGGINGHPIQAYYQEFPIQELLAPGGQQRAEQGMCEYFKQKGVTLAVPFVSATGVFNSCAEQANMVSVATHSSDEVMDSQRFNQVRRTHFRPNWLTGERRERSLVPLFRKIGFFTDSARVGVMVADTPANRRIATAALMPALSGIGADVVKIVYYDPASTDYQSYVLQMRQEDASHIFWAGCACGGTQPQLFMTAAENQQYRPTYALASDAYIGSMAPQGAPKAQLSHVVALGWAPFSDTSLAEYDGAAPLNSADATCRHIWTASGLAKKQPLIVMALYCEALLFLQHAFEGAKDLTASTLRSIVESPAFAYDSPTIGRTTFGPNHHDGATGVRKLTYDAGCDCFKAHGSTLPLGKS